MLNNVFKTHHFNIHIKRIYTHQYKSRIFQGRKGFWLRRIFFDNYKFFVNSFYFAYNNYMLPKNQLKKQIINTIKSNIRPYNSKLVNFITNKLNELQEPEKPKVTLKEIQYMLSKKKKDIIGGKQMLFEFNFDNFWKKLIELSKKQVKSHLDYTIT